jgi:uncharacterized protein YbjT (DUF2867 family)
MSASALTPASTLLLSSANGRTGRAILSAMNRRGVAVRAFVRKATQWPDLERLGAREHATGDLGDAASVERACEGCDAAMYIGPPMHPDEVTMAGNFLRAAQRAEVRHFIYYSVLHPVSRSIRHHRLKLEFEERLVDANLPFTVLQPARYMQHLEPLLPQVINDGVHSMPFSTDVRFSVVDLLDLAEVAALVAYEERHFFATYELAGPQTLSQTDMARILGGLLDREVVARSLPLDEMAERARRASASEDRIAQMRSMNGHYDRHGMPGNPNVLRWLLGREPTRFEDYARRVIEQRRRAS